MNTSKGYIYANSNFEQLFEQWNRKIYNYTLVKTKSVFIAEEVVQRVLIKLWNNLKNKNIEINIEAQIFCLTKSTIIDVLKIENRRKHHSLESSKTQRQYQETPFDIYNIKELQAAIDNQIFKMPKIRRQVFMLSRKEQLSYREISKKLDITVKTVENHINLALKQLRKNLFLPIIIFLFF